MKITCKSSDSEYPEVFESLEALERELRLSADDDYADNVLGQSKAGATVVRVANGPRDTDTYTVEQ